MIGQEAGLKYFMPIAVNLLINEPFIKVIDYNGDLLSRLLRLESKYWKKKSESKDKLIYILKSLKTINDTQMTKNTKVYIEESILHFLNKYSPTRP